MKNGYTKHAVCAKNVIINGIVKKMPKNANTQTSFGEITIAKNA